MPLCDEEIVMQQNKTCKPDLTPLNVVGHLPAYRLHEDRFNLGAGGPVTTVGNVLSKSIFAWRMPFKWRPGALN